jgi:hypothetical protein
MKLAATMLRQIIKEEVAAARRGKQRSLVSEVTITAKEYRLFKALLRRHPELAGEVNEDEVDVLKVAEALNWAMGEPFDEVTDADEFFGPENEIQYWMTDAGRLVVELRSEDGRASGACIPSAANLKAMGMKSHSELAAFLGEQGAKQAKDPKELFSRSGRKAAGLKG